jgi:hypothetical protein
LEANIISRTGVGIMNNPIPKNEMFFTPENLEELFKRLDSFSNGHEKALAYQIAMITLNTCSNIIDKMIEETHE